MPFYLLIIRNRLTSESKAKLDAALAAQADYFKRHTPLTFVYDFLDTNLDTKFKDFGIVSNIGDFAGDTKTSYGLDGIKDQLRTVGIENYKYSQIVFCYEVQNFDDSKGQLAAWTYPNPLQGAAFTEIPSYGFDQRVLTHEPFHGFHRLCWFKGIATKDTLDLFDKEFDVEAPDGNRARNLKELSPYWSTIAQLPVSRALEAIKQKALVILAQLQSLVVSKVSLWANAIKTHEGYYPGSRSYRNNNPGNLKYRPYTAMLGATGADKDNFCIFKSYSAGFNALCQLLKDAATGKLKDYNPDMTLFQFYNTYAPASDNNDPNSYALFISQKLGVPPTTPIKTLI
jgi:hypothetical protein